LGKVAGLRDTGRHSGEWRPEARVAACIWGHQQE